MNFLFQLLYFFSSIILLRSFLQFLFLYWYSHFVYILLSWFPLFLYLWFPLSQSIFKPFVLENLSSKIDAWSFSGIVSFDLFCSFERTSFYICHVIWGQNWAFGYYTAVILEIRFLPLLMVCFFFSFETFPNYFWKSYVLMKSLFF